MTLKKPLGVRRLDLGLMFLGKAPENSLEKSFGEVDELVPSGQCSLCKSEGPEFHSQNPHTRCCMLSSPALGNQGQVDPRGLLVSQSKLADELQAHRRPCLKRRQRASLRTLEFVLWTSHPHTQIRMCLHVEEVGGDSEMAPWVKVFPSTPDDLSSIPQTHRVEGENQLTKALLRPPHTFSGTRVPTPIHANDNECCFKGVFFLKERERKSTALLEEAPGARQRGRSETFQQRALGATWWSS